jgi:hypothetical protein
MRAVMFSIFLVLVCACQGVRQVSGTLPGQPDPTVFQPMTQEWSLVLLSSCADAQPERCQAAYSFEVRSDGAYRVGPGPKDQELNGYIEAAELVSLREGLDDARVPGSGSLCEQNGATRDTETLSMTWNESVYRIVQATTEEQCFRASEMKTAQWVRDKMRALATRYYPPEFPNPCFNALSDLEKEYQDVASCESGADCTLVDEGFVPLRPGARLDATEDCGYPPRMRSANTFLVVSRQLKLLVARDLAAKICGPQLRRPTCMAPFSGTPRVACIQGQCQIVKKTGGLP